MSKQDKIPCLNLDPMPSPPKRPRNEDRTKSVVKSLIQRAPEAEDGEIVSSPELDAADIEINIHAEMTTSGESDAEEETTPSPEKELEIQPSEVIQIIDTPEKVESSTPKEEFPQKEQPSSTKRVALLKDDDDVEIDHLEISAPLQKEAKKPKVKTDKSGSPKGKYSSPEKKDRASQRISPREDSSRKRPYDVFDEKRSGRSDSESEIRIRRSEKSNTEEMEDLRKRLLKKTMGSERYARDLEKEKRKEKDHERKKDYQDRGKLNDKLNDKLKSQSKHPKEKDREKHGRTQQSMDSKSQSKSKDARDNVEHDRKDKKDSNRSDSSRKSRPYRSDDKQRKKKKKKHRSDDEKDNEQEEVKEKIMEVEKSPSTENPAKESSTYDDITSDSSNHASPAAQTAKSPSPSHSPSPDESISPQQSPLPSLSGGSLSRSPTPVRSPTPIKKRSYFPAIEGCRNVEEFTWLNRIEEGTYGVVYRAKDKRSDEVVALKRLKMEKEREGFPITSLREINTLLKAQHPNIVTVREIVVGSNMDKIYIVMDYVEHDLKSLMETMTQPFLVGEVKTLMLQLLRGVRHMHDNWILHRDIKASNLLLSHKGILKIGDFGLAREYGSPLKKYTSIVVTLWYRAPELLLGGKEYSTAIDIWSVGCVFAELLTMKPLFPGKSEIDQLNRIFKELGTPNDKIWPGPPAYSEHPQVKKMNIVEHPYNILRQRFGTSLTDRGFDLMNKLLTYDPSRRLSADDALRHGYFEEAPTPVDPSMFPTWPAKSELGHKTLKKKNASPKAPEGGAEFNQQGEDGGGFHMSTTHKGSAAKGLGFNLKF